MANGKRITFESFQLEPENGRLWSGEEEVALRPKSFAVLRYLLEHQGRLVTKEELLKTLWAGTVVSDGVLKVCVREIRKALGETAKEPRFIETVPRKGYRFIAPAGTSAGTRLSDAEREGFERIVGRQDDLKKLQRWLEKAERGERQIVFVTGGPGIGKTTLVDLFIDCSHVEDRMRIGRGLCLERYGEGEAYLPVLEALGRIGREPGGKRLTEILRKFAPTWLVQMPALVEDAEFELLQRKVQGTTRERMLREITEAIEAFTEDRGLVLVLRDLQWSDYSTLELVSYLAHRRERARLMIIGTYRPEDIAVAEHPLQSVKRELHARGQCEEIQLRPLTEAEVQEYVARVLAPRTLPAGLGQLIHRRTDGNPLFMVNLVDFAMSQGLVAAGEGAGEVEVAVEEIERTLPDNLRQVIQKQAEALGTDALQVLEAASVAGLEFAAATVAAATKLKTEEVEACCDALARRGKVFCSREAEEWPDGTISARYRFIHRLCQQVLYELMGDAQRVRTHRLMGERKEAGYKQRAQEIAGELALHFDCGRDYQRAVRYHGQAGENDLRRRAYREAAQHIRRGLELMGGLLDAPEHAEQEIRLQCALARALIPAQGPGAHEVQAAHARAWKLCQKAGETAQLGPALLGLASSNLAQGRIKASEEVATQALRLAERAEDQTLALSAHSVLGFALLWGGALASARDHLEQSMALSVLGDEDALGLFPFDIRVRSLSLLSLAVCLQGYADQAVSKSHEAIRLAEEASAPFDVASARFFAAFVHLFRREGPQTTTQAEASMVIAAEHGFPFFTSGATILKGWALAVAGQAEAGISMLREGLNRWRQTGMRLLEMFFLGLLAEAHGRAGKGRDALATLEEALAGLTSGEKQVYEAELYRLKGMLMLGQAGDAPGKVGSDQSAGRKGAEERQADAEAYLQKALDIARQQGAKTWELRAALGVARALRIRGENEEARRTLEQAYTWFTEGFETPDLQEAKTLLGELAH